MISRVSGKILSWGDGVCEIEAGGLTYSVRVGERKAGTVGSEITLFTHLHQRDEGPFLYGFLTQEERKAFYLLLTVHGVGPKLAQAAVLALGPEGLARAVSDKNLAALSKVPGLGRKRAETLVQELKDKFQDMKLKGVSSLKSQGNDEDEAIEGLRALGYKDEEIGPALDAAGKGSTEERLRKAIGWLGGHR